MAKRFKPVLPAITEDAFLRQVLQLAAACGWRSAHFRPARTAKGWRTGVSGDGKGFPDLVLVKGHRLIFAELKRDGEKPTTEQYAWIRALGRATREVYVWRPVDIPAIRDLLMGELSPAF